MINVNLENDGRLVLTALQTLEQRSADLRKALAEIGEELVESQNNASPIKLLQMGKKWLDNKPSTIERKGRDQPLTGNGILGSQIFYNLIANDTLEVGSNLEYAAMQQFGGAKSEPDYV